MVLIHENGFQLVIELDEALAIQEQLAKATAHALKHKQSSFTMGTILQERQTDYASKICFVVMNRS